MTIQISLFPIPNLVVFPGTTVPLHVFEPRYRAMVHDSVDANRMIGVVHTRKTIHEGKRNETIEDALSTNQATYQPFDVFSAGYCEIVRLLDDGRIHIVVRAEHRYRIESEVQTLPYRIVEATEVVDQEEENPADAFYLKVAVNDRLIELLRPRNEHLVEILESDRWVSQPADEYSFRLFQILSFEADVMQQILETTVPSERLHIIQGVLSQVSG